MTPAQRTEADILARSLEHAAAQLRALSGPVDADVWAHLRQAVAEVGSLLMVAETLRMGRTSPPASNRASEIP